MSITDVRGGKIVHARHECPFPELSELEPGDVFVCGECGKRHRLTSKFDINVGYLSTWVKE